MAQLRIEASPGIPLITHVFPPFIKRAKSSSLPTSIPPFIKGARGILCLWVKKPIGKGIMFVVDDKPFKRGISQDIIRNTVLLLSTGLYGRLTSSSHLSKSAFRSWSVNLKMPNARSANLRARKRADLESSVASSSS